MVLFGRSSQNLSDGDNWINSTADVTSSDLPRAQASGLPHLTRNGMEVGVDTNHSLNRQVCIHDQEKWASHDRLLTQRWNHHDRLLTRDEPLWMPETSKTMS